MYTLLYNTIKHLYCYIIILLHTVCVACDPFLFISRFAGGADSFQPPNGRKWVEGLRNCKGTWHARRMHMTKQSQVTFHGHHFKAIMGFIMHGYAPRWVNNINPCVCKLNFESQAIACCHRGVKRYNKREPEKRFTSYNVMYLKVVRKRSVLYTCT